MLCKFTPLGFETARLLRPSSHRPRCVNLPRWGLKLGEIAKQNEILKCKFTPLGFETDFYESKGWAVGKCKFTPLGFETFISRRDFTPLGLCKFTPLGFETSRPRKSSLGLYCVNLPRWGLKHTKFKPFVAQIKV